MAKGRSCRLALAGLVLGWVQAATVLGGASPSEARSPVESALRQAAAEQATGRHRQSIVTLQRSLLVAQQTGNPAELLRARHKLGAALTLAQQHAAAEPLLQESVQQARDTRSPELPGILNDAANLWLAQGKTAEALTAYRECVTLARAAGDPLLAAQALCNLARASHAPATDALPEIDKLPEGADQAFLLISAALLDRQAQVPVRAQESLRRALGIAERSGDQRLASSALGNLGQLYRDDGQLEAALALARRAVFAAQAGQAPELLYRWEWLAGGILQRQGNLTEATGAYRRAVRTLQPIRHDVALGCGCAGAGGTFRETHGGLFFELADLLLQQSAAETDAARVQTLLLEARDTVEQLKTAELEDYFQDDCVSEVRLKTKALEAVDPRSAVVYLVPLPTRTEVLVGLRTGLRQFTVPVGSERLVQEVRDFRRNLETRTTYEYLLQARQLYDWLLRPLEPVLQEHGVDTLVFVPDGALQTIPYACLQDGERFLIERYAVAAVPGLSLIDPRPVARGQARLLLGGLSKAVQGFPALDFVPGELEQIQPLYRSNKLLNDTFVLPVLRRSLAEEEYSIVHLASHGQFSRDIRNTFLLTYDGKLTLNELEALIRPSQYRGRPVEMLILSACQTAAGDDRAALGLAGVAVKAGARSAVATLWFVNDQSTAALVSELYQQLRSAPTTTKAKALQAAQQKMLEDRRYRHPCYWAPYLVIGNWL